MTLHLERARSESEVGLDDLDTLGEELVGLFGRNAGVDDNIVTLLPVTGSGDTMLVTELKRVDDTKDLIKVTASGSGVAQDETDGLLGIDDENGTDSEGDTLAINVGDILNSNRGQQASSFKTICHHSRPIEHTW
jgi:hypothetical protein